MSYNQVVQKLKQLSDIDKKISSEYFFKTEKGSYSYGDKFIGVTVPEQRKVAKEFVSLAFGDIEKLLQSKIHEYRLTALLILVERYKKGSDKEKSQIFNFYKKNISGVNNWDLVDSSADDIFGDFLFFKNSTKEFFTLAKSKDLWQNRITIVATFAFIKKGRFDVTLKLSEYFLSHKHDLIHKACGWMLREVGKRDKQVLVNFLNKNSKNMPRTMLRYAIEHFSPEIRKKYMAK